MSRQVIRKRRVKSETSDIGEKCAASSDGYGGSETKRRKTEITVSDKKKETTGLREARRRIAELESQVNSLRKQIVHVPHASHVSDIPSITSTDDSKVVVAVTSLVETKRQRKTHKKKTRIRATQQHCETIPIKRVRQNVAITVLSRVVMEGSVTCYLFMDELAKLTSVCKQYQTLSETRMALIEFHTVPMFDLACSIDAKKSRTAETKCTHQMLARSCEPAGCGCVPMPFVPKFAPTVDRHATALTSYSHCQCPSIKPLISTRIANPASYFWAVPRTCKTPRQQLLRVLEILYRQYMAPKLYRKLRPGMLNHLWKWLKEKVLCDKKGVLAVFSSLALPVDHNDE